jgi:hypothetical protein
MQLAQEREVSTLEHLFDGMTITHWQHTLAWFSLTGCVLVAFLYRSK